MRIPTYDQRQVGPTVAGQPSAPSGPAGVGQALMNAGMDFMAQHERRLRADMAQQEARQRQQEELSIQRALLDAETTAERALTEVTEGAPEDGAGVPEALAERYRAWREEAQGAWNGMSAQARELLDLRLDRLASGLDRKGQDFTRAARVAKTRKDVGAIIDGRANAALSDPDSFDRQIGHIEEMLGAFDLPDAARRGVMEDARRTIGTATLRGLIDRDPSRAMAELDGGGRDADLKPDAKAILRNQAEGAIRQREAQARQEAAINRALMAAELKDTEAALRAGENVSINPDRIRATLGDKQAAPVLADLERAARFGADAKAIQWATPDELSRLLSERHPRTGRPVIHNPDGTISTEESITITDERINNGAPTNIPSIWEGKRPPEKLDDIEKEDWAIKQALASGQKFQAFDSIDTAVKAAESRTQMLGDTANDIRGFADRQRDHAALVQMVQQRQRALATDPAGYVAQAPAVAALEGKQKVEASLAEQNRLGVPVAMQRVLSKAEASQIVAEMQAGGINAQDVGERFVAMQNQYGKDYWGQAFSELADAGLPAGAFVLGTMEHREQEAARTAMAEAIRTGTKNLRELVEPKALTDLPTELQQAMADFTATMLYSPGGQGNAARMSQGVELLALQYMARGDDAAKAAKRAYADVIGKHYSFTDTFRVPRPYDVDEVEDAANALQSALTRVDTPSSRYGDKWQNQESNFLRSVKRQGFWVTNGDEKGLILMDGLGNPVTVDGQPVTLSFDQAVTGP